MNFARLNTIYWTDNLTNDEDTGEVINADINKTFTSNLVYQASDYVCAVERLELSLNGVPYYDGVYNEESIQVIGSGDTIDGVVYDPDTIYQTIQLNFKSYSLKHTIDQLNTTFASIVAGNPSSDGGYVVGIDADGFITFTRTNHDKYRITIPKAFNRILGLYNEDTSDGWVSEYPRWDMGDELQNIRISSNLNLVSDTVGQAKTNIVTDLSVGTSLSAGSDGSYSYTSRDRLIYTPQNRRWLNFNSNSPIQIIRVYCEYVLPDGSSRVVQLPPGGIFNIKLGFYQRI